MTSRMPRPSPSTAPSLSEAAAQAEQKLERLRSITPYLIDATLRENAVGSELGLTVENKLVILEKTRSFGFARVLLGCLNYADPDELTVEDDFLKLLRDRRLDRSGGFALIDPGLVSSSGQFEPSLSQRRWAEYEIPNAIVEIYLADDSLSEPFNEPEFALGLEKSVQWIQERASHPEIIINIVDGCDAFAQNPERVEAALKAIARLPITGVSVEDDRGTFLPFQVGAYFAKARALLPASMRLLAHIHAGAGYENASMMEALCHGADGAWGGLPKRAAIIGHASLGELLANLARLGNPCAREYRIERLLPLCRELSEIIDGEPPLADLPILGANAYRLSLGFFRQKEGRFMDLPPESIGGAYSYRVCPMVSDPEAIIGRLCEILEEPAEAFPKELALRMIRLMRRDLRAGIRTAYDRPVELLRLLDRARSQTPEPFEDRGSGRGHGA